MNSILLEKFPVGKRFEVIVGGVAKTCDENGNYTLESITFDLYPGEIIRVIKHTDKGFIATLRKGMFLKVTGYYWVKKYLSPIEGTEIKAKPYKIKNDIVKKIAERQGMI